MMKFSTPFEVFDWISSFINLEQDLSMRNFRLDRMQNLAKICKNPQTFAQAFHIAGSKGKGSISGMICSILNQAGMKCSLYASPHVMDFRERLSMGANFFDDEVYKKAGDELKETVEIAIQKFPGEEYTFFELMTLWYFLCSRVANVNAISVETGMGGRLDATNILMPAVSVISIIELEHTEYLGTSIKTIAGEKAGIIKKGKPVVLAKQKHEALEVFKSKVLEMASPLYYFPEYGEISNVKLEKKGTVFNLKLKNPKDEKLLFLQDICLSLHGLIQAENAGLAILALKTIFPNIEERAIRKGLQDFSLPARFQRLDVKQDFIVDGAHTSSSVQNTVNIFTDLYGDNGILVFGCAKDKDVKAMAEICLPCFSKIIITTPGTFKKSSPEAVYEVFQEAAAELSKPPEIIFIPETEKAIKHALEFGRDLSLPILGTGSFYLAAEILNLINQ